MRTCRANDRACRLLTDAKPKTQWGGTATGRGARERDGWRVSERGRGEWEEAGREGARWGRHYRAGVSQQADEAAGRGSGTSLPLYIFQRLARSASSSSTALLPLKPQRSDQMARQWMAFTSISFDYLQDDISRFHFSLRV